MNPKNHNHVSTDYDTERLGELFELTVRHGWREALNTVYPDLVRYLNRPNKYVALLPLDGAEVLEIGPGFGQFTAELAARAKSVVALEADKGQAHFLGERLRQEGISNVEVADSGSDCRLPYEDGRFDLIVLNLVFEWCACRLSGDLQEGQELLLSEMRRVLKPGGKLYLATKNRFALRYLLAKPDEHFNGLRFGSALPRWLAKAIYKQRPRGRLIPITDSRICFESMASRLNSRGGQRLICATRKR